MKLASEKNLNKFAFPIFPIRGRTIEHPYLVDSNFGGFALDQGIFGPRNMMVLDILGTFVIHTAYNKAKGAEVDFAKRIPTQKDDRVMGRSSDYMSYRLLQYLAKHFQRSSADGIVPRSYYSDENNLSRVDAANKRAKKVVTITFTDFYLKKQLSFLKRHSSEEIYMMIKETSEAKMRMNYPVRYYDGNKYWNFPFHNYNDNSSCSFFTLLNVSNSSVSKDGRILDRKYEITFNTFLGYFFVQNCISCYTDLVPDKFYLMSDYAQLFYRHLILPYYGTVKNPISVEEIRKRLVFKTPDTYMVRKTIQRILEELESNSFIKDPKQEKLNGEYVVFYTKTPWRLRSE
jgi:hypothetical protein